MNTSRLPTILNQDQKLQVALGCVKRMFPGAGISLVLFDPKDLKDSAHISNAMPEDMGAILRITADNLDKKVQEKDQKQDNLNEG